MTAARMPDGWVFITKVSGPKVKDGEAYAEVSIEKRDLVICKNCKHFNAYYVNHDGMCMCSGEFMDNDDYCSLGERRDDYAAD